jgi:saccharopine dehydrogenase-like NADP-dependent oxidoreductase
MGRVATRTAAGLGLLDEIVVADLDGDAASAFGRRLRRELPGPTRIGWAAVDAMDGAALRAFLLDADVVLNTSGPFYRLGVPILDAAVAARCHYLDICDDWEPTLEMLERDGAARAAGVTAVLGLGASPGASNLLAALAVRELDSVEDLYTVWPVDVGGDLAAVEPAPAPRRPGAAVVHWMQQISGRIRVLDGGKFVDVSPLEPVRIPYPGIGEGTVYTVGHPEPLTLGRGGAVGRRCACAMVVSPRVIAVLRELRTGIDSGKLTNESAAEQLTRFAAGTARVSAGDLHETEGPGALPPFFAYARGTKGGAPTSAGALVLGMPRGMAGATGIPLALGLRMLCEGVLSRRGVFAPEDVIDPVAFFDALAPYCDPPLRGAAEMVHVQVGAPPP